MKEFLWHITRNLAPIDILFLMIGSCFVGIFLTLIIMLEKSKVKYTYYSKKPHKMSLAIGHRGTTPVYGVMYSPQFVRFLWNRLKKQWAIIEAIKKVTGGKMP